ncbi:BTAD domain-containing putative transcriptional regulator [Actinokineospora sp.]|uniref:AfsR/SARP family transcriptional regulator n=1 Tax=Actinokineospora sp. TaxID=1872133 RepID=UPI003D6A61E6
MEVLLLGPLEVRCAGRIVPVTSPMQRVVLASLALCPGRMVSNDELVERLWDHSPPASARATLHNHLMRLRKALSVDGCPAPILTRPPGYVLDLAADQTDLGRFDGHLTRARAARSAGDLAAESGELRAALALWRGHALVDIPSESLRMDLAPQWDEKRLSAEERGAEVDLALGRHAELVGRLRALVAENPLREPFSAYLMTALHGAGRVAEALEVYRTTGARLLDELGVEPGAHLRRAHAEVLTAADEDPAVPAELPHRTPVFVGRDEELRFLRGRKLAVISGTAGMGKSALAVRWAHSIADDHPDGQIYLDLRGFRDGVEPVRPVDALVQILRSLGVDPTGAPDDLETLTRFYRTRIAGRRILLLLDNARDAAQVRPLLPGGQHCTTVITSRNRLGELMAATVVADVLSDRETLALFAAVLGADRVEAEPDAVAELCGLCANLPLAARVAAANLAGTPRMRIADFVAELRESTLPALVIDGAEESAVALAFQSSYLALPESARTLFRRLGAVPGKDATARTVAAVAEVPMAEARRLLKTLIAASLLENHLPGRYRFHDLLRAYAAQLAQADPGTGPAINRVLASTLDWAHAAAVTIAPEFTRLERGSVGEAPALRIDEAVDWFTAERANLVAAVEHACAHGPAEYGWHLADALRSFFHGTGYLRQWREVGSCALGAAQRVGDPHGQASMWLLLAAQSIAANDVTRATAELETAREWCAKAEWARGLWAAENNLGAMLMLCGRPRDALPHAMKSVELTRDAGAARGEATAQSLLAMTYRELGHLDSALAHETRARDLNQAAGLRAAEMRNTGDLGLIHYDLGNLAEAESHLTEAIHAYRQFSSPLSMVAVLCYRSLVRRDSGDLAGGLADARSALETAQNFPAAEPMVFARHALAESLHARGDFAAAKREHELALSVAEGMGFPTIVLDALIGLARDEAALGDFRAAIRTANRARAITRERGLTLLSGRAASVLGSAYKGLGRLDHAERWSAEAGRNHYR